MTRRLAPEEIREIALAVVDVMAERMLVAVPANQETPCPPSAASTSTDLTQSSSLEASGTESSTSISPADARLNRLLAKARKNKLPSSRPSAARGSRGGQ